MMKIEQTPAAVGSDAQLGPLPERFDVVTRCTGPVPVWTAEDMRAYAEQQVAAALRRCVAQLEAERPALVADAARYRWLRDHPDFIVVYRQVGSDPGTREWLMCHAGYAFGSWWPTHAQAVDYAMRNWKDDCGSEVLETNADVQTLRSALTEIRDRIKAHPMYAELTLDEEIQIGGDTAELSYLARVADEALAGGVGRGTVVVGLLGGAR
jgi:hypothetical protein